MRRAAQPTEAARRKMRGVLYNIDGRYTQYKGPGGRRRFLEGPNISYTFHFYMCYNVFLKHATNHFGMMSKILIEK